MNIKSNLSKTIILSAVTVFVLMTVTIGNIFAVAEPTDTATTTTAPPEQIYPETVALSESFWPEIVPLPVPEPEPEPEPEPVKAPEPVRVPKPTTTQPEAQEAPSGPSGGFWDELAQCESGGNWSMNSGNGFTGGVQFMTSTWLAQGGGKYAPAAYLATKAQQIEIAERTLASGGYGQWPACTRKMGYR